MENRGRGQRQLDAPEGGVNTSLNLDSHGKSFGYLILGLPIDE
jgi:hypothetical protein